MAKSMKNNKSTQQHMTRLNMYEKRWHKNKDSNLRAV